jgi:hypothetical protein
MDSVTSKHIFKQKKMSKKIRRGLCGMAEVTHTAWRELLRKHGLLQVADILEKYGIASVIDVYIGGCHGREKVRLYQQN